MLTVTHRPQLQGTLKPKKRKTLRLRVGAESQRFDTLVDAGPKTDVPDHSIYERSPLNRLLMKIFRDSLVDASGTDSQYQGFDGIMDLTRQLNDARKNTSEETREKATQVLRLLFPSWFTAAVTLCISRPFPNISARINAWTTSVACTWLMGAMEVNDIDLEDGTVGKGQGVLVERCRFLEEAGCASICHNSCKIPTQAFFKREMGIDVTLEPDYEDFSCQYDSCIVLTVIRLIRFYFGKAPPPEAEDPILQTPCFLQCPTKKRFSASCSDPRAFHPKQH